jgi:hypothetical protein
MARRVGSETVERGKRSSEGSREADSSAVECKGPLLLVEALASEYVRSSLPHALTIALAHKFMLVSNGLSKIRSLLVPWSTSPRTSRAAWSRWCCVGRSVAKSRSMLTSASSLQIL